MCTKRRQVRHISILSNSNSNGFNERSQSQVDALKRRQESRPINCIPTRDLLYVLRCLPLHRAPSYRLLNGMVRVMGVVLEIASAGVLAESQGLLGALGPWSSGLSGLPQPSSRRQQHLPLLWSGIILRLVLTAWCCDLSSMSVFPWLNKLWRA